MTDQQKEKLVAFFYLLTRGTPECAGVPWGAVNGILRNHIASDKVPVFTSPGGEALAREIVDKLLAESAPGTLVTFYDVDDRKGIVALLRADGWIVK